MLRYRSNILSFHNPGIDPRVGTELSKIQNSIPRVTYGDSFPGRTASFGDLHYYTGDTDDTYDQNYWYIKTTGPDAAWQILGYVPTTVDLGDFLPRAGGSMYGPLTGATGLISMWTNDVGYLTAETDPLSLHLTGGTMAGSIDMDDHNITNVHDFTSTNLTWDDDFGELLFINTSYAAFGDVNSYIYHNGWYLKICDDSEVFFDTPLVDLNTANLTTTGIATVGGLNPLLGTGFLKHTITTGALSIDTNTYLTAETDPAFNAWLIATPPLYALAFAGLSDYPADAVGVLTNDGAGALSWAPAGGSGMDMDGGDSDVLAGTEAEMVFSSGRSDD